VLKHVVCSSCSLLGYLIVRTMLVNCWST